MTAAGFFSFLEPFFQQLAKFKTWIPKRGKNKESQRSDKYITWGLGIENPFYLSSKFSVDQPSITINGHQITHNHSWPVKYSIVKTNKFGTSITYFDSVIFYGNYSDSEFNHTFQIPIGADYQLEVFNYYKYQSTGKIQIIQNRGKSIFEQYCQIN